MYLASTVEQLFGYFVRNCYFSIEDQVFQKVIVIPMGSDPAPFFAHLFLFCYEWEYINNLKKENVMSAWRVCHTVIFSDDLITINKIQDSRYQTKLFDKWDTFDFNIIRMPYKSSNIPNKTFYSAMSSEVLWICKETTKFQDFWGLIKHMKKGSIETTFTSQKECFIEFRRTNDYISNKLL